MPTLIMLVVCFLLNFASAAFGDDTPATALAPPSAPSTLAVLGGLCWTFLNSTVGAGFVAILVSGVVTMIVKANPKAKEIYDHYKPVFFDAVRAAEKAIPDDTPNPAFQKMDMALKLALQLEPKLATVNETDLRRAITQAHDELKS